MFAWYSGTFFSNKISQHCGPNAIVHYLTRPTYYQHLTLIYHKLVELLKNIIHFSRPLTILLLTSIARKKVLFGHSGDPDYYCIAKGTDML
jgi:hypothetical protein